MAPLVAYLFAFLVWAVPPTDQTAAWGEPAHIASWRYARLAETIVDVAESEPPLFDGDDAVARTALLVASVITFESQLRASVDAGTCTRVHGRCVAWCPMRIAVWDGTTPEGWTGRELAADPHLCIRTGLAMMRDSMRECAALEPMSRLSLFTTGKCTDGEPYSVIRASRAARWWNAFPLRDG